METCAESTSVHHQPPKKTTMQPSNDKTNITSEAQSDDARQKKYTATTDELDPILRNTVNKSPRTEVPKSPYSVALLLLYTLTHMAFIQPVSSLLGREFLIPFIFMVLVALFSGVHLGEVAEAYEKLIDATRLACDKALKDNNSILEAFSEDGQNMSDLLKSSLARVQNIEKATQETGTSLNQIEAIRETDLRIFRREANEMRLGYYQTYLVHYETLIDVIEHIVKKVKTMAAPPKVKGTKRNGNNRNKTDNNLLTEPLENFAASLQERQSTTKKQIAVSEKVKVILEHEDLLPEEVDRLLREAEADLQRAQDSLVVQTSPSGSGAVESMASPSSLGGSIDERLEKHYEGLDKWYQSVQDRPVVRDED
jgi:hypothetical protein